MVVKKLFLFMVICTMVACSSKNKGDDEDIFKGEGDKYVKFKLTKETDPRTYGGEKSADQILIDNINSNFKGDNEGYGPIDVVGIWAGQFGNNFINISLTKIEGNRVDGYSVCAGNFRKISGYYETEDNLVYNFQMNESGTHKNDGVFDFSISMEEMEMKGSWKPFKEKGNSPKEYLLTKRKFVYDPHVGEFPDASLRVLDYNDVENMDEDKLTKIRNEIYARHGYSFKNKKWRQHFEQKDWYIPMGLDIRDKLTDIEVQNIELIYEYESYYNEEYDSYGR